MPDLRQSLQDRDYAHLRIVASLWGFELTATERRAALDELEEAMLSRLRLLPLLAGLPEHARLALGDLIESGGRLPRALFERRHGTLRSMGAARRDREQPYLHTDLAAEILWYRGLLALAFFDTPEGPQEFAYIPDDLLSLLYPLPEGTQPPPGRPAAPAERLIVEPASERILDHATTLLAGLRLGMAMAELGRYIPGESEGAVPAYPIEPQVLQTLLAEAGLLTVEGAALPEAVKAFLEAPRAEALATLARAWLPSIVFNELRQLPGLRFDGEWQNDPRRTRESILGFLASLPAGTWWSLTALTAAIKETAPDFQRPSGDYDSWFIRREGSEQYLRGFAHWEAVEGELLRYMIAGPLHWLGVTDIAFSELIANGEPTADGKASVAVSAFRLSGWAAALLGGEVPQGLPADDQRLSVLSDARLRVPRLAPRAVRYQLARCCKWETVQGEDYVYRLTPSALASARRQGLRTGQILAILRKNAGSIPPNVSRALERWEEQGSQARLQPALVLRLSSPEILQALRSSRAARFLGETLGPAAVAVKPNAGEKVLAVLAELGYLGEMVGGAGEDAP